MSASESVSLTSRFAQKTAAQRSLASSVKRRALARIDTHVLMRDLARYFEIDRRHLARAL
jgi:hypothetical protein